MCVHACVFCERASVCYSARYMCASVCYSARYMCASVCYSARYMQDCVYLVRSTCAVLADQTN